MKKKLLVLSLAFAMIMISVVLTGCGNSSGSKDKSKIVIGTCSVSKDLAESGKEELEKMGYKVEIKVFDDYVLPNDALVDGSIDANLYQHEPYMDNYNKSNSTDIIMMEPKLYNFYSGIYSTKAKSIAKLPDGGKVGLAEDASNHSEDLKRLQKVGLITLSEKPSSGEFYTDADITKNPHNYEFVTGDSNKYKNMDDYTFIIGTSNTMAEAGVDPTKHLLKKFEDDSLAEGICVMKDNKDKQWAKDIMTAYTSAAAKKNVPASSGFEPLDK